MDIKIDKAEMPRQSVEEYVREIAKTKKKPTGFRNVFEEELKKLGVNITEVTSTPKKQANKY